MAEAHAAVAFSFTVSSEGVSVDINRQAFRELELSGTRALKKRIARFKNSVCNQVYPFHPSSWFFVAFGVFAATYLGLDYKKSPIPYIEEALKSYLGWTVHYHVPACILFSLMLWFGGSLLNQLILRLLLSYTGWMYLPRGKKSLKIAIWWTLLSVKHLYSSKEYANLVHEAQLFRNGLGPKLQIFLWLKTWITSNYVTDWWEEYVYLAGRDPIMSNSNFYGLEWHRTRDIKPTQSARAALMTYLLLQVRRRVVREELSQEASQHRRFKLIHIVCQFDHIVHSVAAEPYPGEENLAALTAGPRDLWAVARSTHFTTGTNRVSLDTIEKAAFFVALDDEANFPDPDSPDYLSYLGKTCLTGNCHNRWFDKSFCMIVLPNAKCGFNAEHSWADAPIISHLLEMASVDECQCIDNQTPGMHYTRDGKCDGQAELKVIPRRLVWEFQPSCIEMIESSLAVARNLADAIDLVVTQFTDYGRCFIKRAGYSPDAYIQMTLQVAYFMDQNTFALVYESCMTRLFREGRTETVRSCTAESTEFVRALLDEKRTVSVSFETDIPFTNQSNLSLGLALFPLSHAHTHVMGNQVEERARLFRIATDRHQNLTRDAISGKGVDRHLFALYIVSKFFSMESPFLKQILSAPWRLSTSQTPTNQTSKMTLPPDHPDSNRVYGGGFGPVDKEGYGVSYMFSMENALIIHISSRHDCSTTTRET
ncbi:unnamed protein product [Echinostoma caproni]|uniref:Carnitine O-palmitoyltransferase n=1 Tax=Echinostoma caproni TaxID=27848 RepID=A0A183A9X9_9TREM|nr:unnamed protein product [Echinostoma caproni]